MIRGTASDELDGSTSCELCYLQDVLITTVTFAASRKQHDGYYHVVSRVGEGVSEIRKYDRIIRVNGNDVKDLDFNAFQCALKSEVDSLKKSCKKRIKLTLWRWNTSKISEITVQMHFKGKKGGKIIEGELWHTRKHGTLQLTESGRKSCIKIEAEDPGTYVRFQPETKTLTGMKINKDELQFYLFSFTFYECIVFLGKRQVVRYVCTVTCQADDQIYDVVADLDNGEIIIQIQKPISPEVPDNRFFIFYELENGDNVFELFLYANQCVKYDHNERTLTINELGMSEPESKRSFIRPKPSFLFDAPVLDKKSMKNCLLRFRERPRAPFFCCMRSQPEDVDQTTILYGVKFCNEFRLKSENSVIKEMDDVNGNVENAGLCNDAGQCTSTL